MQLDQDNAATSTEGDLSEHRTLLRRCRIIGGDGDCEVRKTIFCPLSLHGVQIRDCFACAHYRGLVRNNRGMARFVMCAQPETPPSRRGASRPGAERIWRIMTTEVICVTPDTSGEALMALLLEGGFGGAPVVEASGSLVGMVTKTDLVREHYSNGATQSCEPLDQGRVELDPGVHALLLPRITVGEIMTPQSFSLVEMASVGRAASLMAAEGLHRVPVVGSDNRVVGIVTTADIVRHLAACGV